MIGGIAALALVVVLAFLFLGKSASQKFESVGAATEPMEFASTGEAISTDSTTATSTSTPTRASVQLDGLWPVATSWASSVCESRDAVTTITTRQSRVAICADQGGNFSYFGLNTGSRKSIDLDATYDSTRQQFTAVNGSTSYIVTPRGLRIMQNGSLSDFQSATAERSGNSIDDHDLLTELVNLMYTSNSGRSAIVDLARGSGSGNCHPAAVDTIDDIIENRAQMEAAGEDLLDQASGSSLEGPIGTFVDAMHASWQYDLYFRDWVMSSCPGGFDAQYPEAAASGRAASSAKQQLAEDVNRLASGTSLKHNWEYTDI